MLLVIESDTTLDPANMQGLIAGLEYTHQFAAVSPSTINHSGDSAVLAVLPCTSPQNLSTEVLVKAPRVDLIPAMNDESNLQVYVTGARASSVDTTAEISERNQTREVLANVQNAGAGPYDSGSVVEPIVRLCDL